MVACDGLGSGTSKTHGVQLARWCDFINREITYRGDWTVVAWAKDSSRFLRRGTRGSWIEGDRRELL